MLNIMLYNIKEKKYEPCIELLIQPNQLFPNLSFDVTWGNFEQTGRPGEGEILNKVQEINFDKITSQIIRFWVFFEKTFLSQKFLSKSGLWPPCNRQNLIDVLEIDLN